MYSSPPAKSRKTGVPVWNIPCLGRQYHIHLPGRYDYWLFASEVNFIAFRDVNGDGQKDVITSEQYISGAGDGGTVPFSMTRIYLNQAVNSCSQMVCPFPSATAWMPPVPKNIPLKISSLSWKSRFTVISAAAAGPEEKSKLRLSCKNDVLNDNRKALSQKSIIR